MRCAACAVVMLVATGCGPKNPETFNLKSGTGVVRHVKFEQGANVQIWVESEEDSDVDLFVYDKAGTRVAADERIDKNCHVTFKPESTQKYKIEVVNRVFKE